MQNPAKYERISHDAEVRAERATLLEFHGGKRSFNLLQTSLSLSLSLSLSFCLPSPPMFPEEELGDILFRSGIHRVGAALDF